MWVSRGLEQNWQCSLIAKWSLLAVVALTTTVHRCAVTVILNDMRSRMSRLFLTLQERRSTLTPKDSNTSEDVEGPRKLVTRTDSMSMEGQGLQVGSFRGGISFHWIPQQFEANAMEILPCFQCLVGGSTVVYAY